MWELPGTVNSNDKWHETGDLIERGSFQTFKASRQFKGSMFNDHTPFQIFRITSCSEACARSMFSSLLMTDKNTSICYLNQLRNTQQGV